MNRRIARTPKTRRRRCVSAKTRYRDHTSAAAALTKIQRKGGDLARCYPCPLCKGWHLTSGL
jgi:hypothetical protein